MGASQALIAEDVLDACDLSRVRHLMDVGGGEGAFLEAVARRHAGPRLTLFDLPPVAERAADRLARVGLEGRIACRGGDFHDGLPTGADAISLVRIVHDHDDGPALAHAEGRPRRAAARRHSCSSRSRWQAPRAPSRSATRISASTCWRWAPAARVARKNSTPCFGPRGFASSRELPTRRPLLTRVIRAKKQAP